MSSNPNPHLARLDALEAAITDLRIELEQLQESAANTDWKLAEHISDRVDVFASEPVYTKRVNLDSTVKDGYRVKEATITVANAKGGDAAREDLRRQLAELIEDGQAVADQMNSQREQVKRFA